MAERVGFEPTVRYERTPDFESGTIDHSATLPGCKTAIVAVFSLVQQVGRNTSMPPMYGRSTSGTVRVSLSSSAFKSGAES